MIVTQSDLPANVAPHLTDCPVAIRVEVRWGEMDAFQHLNNVAYFRYFESARIALFEHFGFISRGLPEGIGPILAETSCRYFAPVRFPDTLYIGIKVGAIGEDRFVSEYVAVSEALGVVAAIGSGTVVSFDYDAGKKAPLPKEWKAKLEGVG